jgi:2-haloacid dehalogenase
MTKPAVVFDLNETLLDMSALDGTFARIFGHVDGAELRKKWFKQVLELFLTATITGQYRSFDKLTDDALHMLAKQQGREASHEDREALKTAQARIPAYPDVRPGLELLKEAGFTIATLTNSSAKSAKKLLEQAGLASLFDQILSVDAVERFKPAREAYAYAARELGVKPDGLLLVAAHAWDIAGALAAGCSAAFVERPEKVLSPGGEKPQFQGRDIRDVARQILAARA